MPARSQSTRYGYIAQLLHWTTALFVLALLVMGKVGLVDADDPASAGFMWHGSLGVLVLVLVAARFLWRLMDRPPPLPSTMTRLGRGAARTMHVALYALVIALPFSGWIGASFERSSINFFNVATLPRAASTSGEHGGPSSVSGAQQERETAGKDQENFAEEVHELLGDVQIVLVSMQVLAALKHQFIDHDGVIGRMLPLGRPKGARDAPVGR